MTTTKGTRKSTKAVIPFLPEEIDHFESEVDRFRAGDIPENEFIAFRLRQGVYGQRQADVQMIRVKIPFGGLNADQLETLAVFAEAYAPLKKGHITTRENIQFHHVLLARTPEILRMLGDVGITTREACGNTIRNVAGCPKAGVCAGEVFDPTPYLVAFARYFVRHPVTQLMPRKIKTAFSGCESDCTITAIHDIGFIARFQETGGVSRKGFKIVVGGGTSIMPRIAPTLYEFVPVEDFLRVSEAVLRVFDRQTQERKNRMKARIKFTVDRLGIDEFRRLVEEELQGDWVRESYDPEPYLWEEDEQSNAPPPSPNGHRANGPPPSEFALWTQTNVETQRHPGYRIVHVLVEQGDLNAEQFRGLAKIAREYAGGRVRLTQQQNLVLRWVREERLLELWNALGEIGLGDPKVDEVTDIVTCPGTDTCKLGITSSMGLGRALKDRLVELKIDDPEIRKLHVKASGCPNGCGQHHIANIGFHGAAIKGASGQQVPAYEIFIGGNADATKGAIRFGQRVKGRVPAKRAPELLERILGHYTEHRQNGEGFNDFVDRVGPGEFAPLVADLQQVGPLGKDTIRLYMDWDKTVPYKLERGEGECAV
ncbi:MAG: nitrite/sulfite reductase [Dehalococcoidia bacterium]